MAHPYFIITKYSHNFAMSQIDPRGLQLIQKFYQPLMQWSLVKENRRFVRKPVKIFAARLKDRSCFRFHINLFDSFIRFLNEQGVHESCYQIITPPANHGVDIGLEVKEGWILRDYQIPINEYILSHEPNDRKLVEIQTGKGKTACAMISAVGINKRICILIRPMYMDKWLSDVQQISNVKLEETLTIRGSDSLMALIDMAKNGTLDAKIIIISNKTFQNWLTMYEDFGDEGIEELGYGCTPPEFFQTIGAGLRLIDEVHQDFHLNFLIDLHTHVGKSISLSATLEADDPFVTKMYELAYPPSTRFRGLQYDRYIKSASWSYRFSQPEKIRTKEFGSASYSHLAFEKSVIKNPVVLESYIDMIESCIRRNFIEYKKPGDKVLVYCSSIDMCTKVSEALKKVFKEFDVRRYVEQDPYDNLMNAEICVSTLLSAGTGHDIKGLTTVILTSAVKSSQSNIQGFGRLRKLDDRDTRFIYFVCLDMEKHVDYHKKKREILEGKALSYNEQYYYTLVG